MPTVEVGCESLSSVLTPALVNVGVKAEAVAVIVGAAVRAGVGRSDPACRREKPTAAAVASANMQCRFPSRSPGAAGFG